MTTITTDSGLHTMIVVFTVEPERQAALVHKLEEVVAWHAEMDGFVSNSILASEDGTRVAEYIQWASREHLVAMTQVPGAMDHVKDPSIVSDAHSYIVSSVTARP